MLCPFETAIASREFSRAQAIAFSRSATRLPSSTRTDARSRAVITYLTPYRVNRVGLEAFELDNELDYNSLLREVAPTSGAVIYVPIRPERMLP